MMFSSSRSSRASVVRTARRWTVLGASALCVGASLLALPGVTPSASADDCPDAEVIFARGTDEPAGMGRVGDALVDALRQQVPALKIRTYAVNYKATKLQLHGGDGAKDAISRVQSTVSACPNTKIVLGGYSQGASVMDIVAGIPVGGISWGSSLPPQYADNVAAVATFGDVADRAGGALPIQSTLLGPKAIDMCNPSDPICHAGSGNSWSGHTEGYVPAYTSKAAEFVASKLMVGRTPPGYGSQMPSYGPQSGYGPESVYGQPPGPQSAYGPVTGSQTGPPSGYPQSPGPGNQYGPSDQYGPSNQYGPSDQYDPSTPYVPTPPAPETPDSDSPQLDSEQWT